LEVLIEGRDDLLFIAKTYSRWELMFDADNSSESSIGSSSNDDSNSDRTKTSELAQPLAE
jgi:hypothetical protein